MRVKYVIIAKDFSKLLIKFYEAKKKCVKRFENEGSFRKTRLFFNIYLYIRSTYIQLFFLG
jgi:hypothetical protein